MAELFFVYSDFSSTPLLTKDFLLFPTESQKFLLHLNVFIVKKSRRKPI